MVDKDLVKQLEYIAIHLKNLGWGQSSPVQRGAIEDLGIQIKDAGENIASSIDHLAEAVSGLGDAVRQYKS